VNSLAKTNKKLLRSAVDGTEDWQDAVEDLSDATQKHERILKSLEDRGEVRERRRAEEPSRADQAPQEDHDFEEGRRTRRWWRRRRRTRWARRWGWRRWRRRWRGSRKSLSGTSREKPRTPSGFDWEFFAKDLKGLAENATRTFGKSLKLVHRGATAGVGGASRGLGSIDRAS